MVKDEGEVVEIEDGSEVDEPEDDVGIFDEDLKDDSDDESEDDSDELVDELEDDSDKVSDFFIGDTILSSGDGEEGWSKEDLEQVVRDERIEKDWQDSEEFVSGDFYNAGAGGDFYGTSSNNSRDGVYETGRGGDLYKGESGGGDVYNTGGEGVYAGKTNAEGVYDVGKRGDMKSYDEVADSRRDGRSMLEVAGFEDKEKQKDRDEHRLNMDYSAKKAD